MYSTIIFLSVGILVLSIMLVIEVNISLDLTRLMVYVEIKVFKIRIITIKINLIKMSYSINNSKKSRRFSILISQEEKVMFMQIKKSILDKLYYDNFNLEISLNTFNPQSTALSFGILNKICYAIQSVLEFSDKDYDLTYNIKSNFISNENIINVGVKVYFTIFDMIFAIMLSFYRRGKYVKQKK